MFSYSVFVLWPFGIRIIVCACLKNKWYICITIRLKVFFKKNLNLFRPNNLIILSGSNIIIAIFINQNVG